MKKTKDLNLPVVILHEVADMNTQYKINGTLLKINEANETATIRFSNGRVENSIPLSDIYINEGFLDTIKNIGRKLFGWVVKKVKGFIAFFNEDGQIDYNSFSDPYNMALAYQKGDVPEAFKMYPAQCVVDFINDNGISYEKPDYDSIWKNSMKSEIDDANRYFSRIMKEIATSDKSVSESIAHVRNKYYKKSGLFEAYCNEVNKKNHLNEADNMGILSVSAIDDMTGRKSMYGREVGTEELKNLIHQNINAQLKISLKNIIRNMKDEPVAGAENMDDEKIKRRLARRQALAQSIIDTQKNIPAKILLIWGAPGIGKTQIVKQCLRDFRNDKIDKINLNIVTVTCSVLERGDMQLPVVSKNKVTINSERVKDNQYIEYEDEINLGDEFEINEVAIDTARRRVLPFFAQTGSAEEELKQQMKFATSAHLTQDGTVPVNEMGEVYQGGILFFDELSRLDKNALSTMMGICQKSLGELKMADSWGMLAASNRDIDDNIQDSAAGMGSFALSDRFMSVHYTPSREEWLKWARSCDKSGFGNILPEIVTFIDKVGDSVWYQCVRFGGFDDVLRTSLDAYLTNDPSSEVYKSMRNRLNNENPWYDFDKKLANELTELTLPDDSNPLVNVRGTFTPRTWHQISIQYRDALVTLFSHNKYYTYDVIIDESEEDYNTNGVYAEPVLRKALEELPLAAWERIWDEYMPRYKGSKLNLPPKRKPSVKAARGLLHEILLNIVDTMTGSSSAYFKMAEFLEDSGDNFREPEVMESIFNTGDVTDELKDQDSIGKTEHGGFKWKSNTQTIKSEFSYILSQYPGALKDDFIEFVTDMDEKVNDLITKCSATIDKASVAKSTKGATKNAKAIFDAFELGTVKISGVWDEMVKIDTLNKGEYKFIADKTMSKLDPYLITYMYNKYDFVKHLFNLTKYIVKTCYTVDGNTGAIAMLADANNKSLINDASVNTDLNKNPYIKFILDDSGLGNNQAIIEQYYKFENNLNKLNALLKDDKNVHIFILNFLLFCQQIINISVSSVSTNFKMQNSDAK